MLASSSDAAHQAETRNIFEAVNLRPALLLLLLLAVTPLFCACVKLPRHTSLISERTTLETSRQQVSGAAAAAVLVNINTASPEELERLPGVGKALAARIVSYRREQGRFRRVEHLLIVPGISERRFRAMRAQITVE
ncbi:MAG TPA: helix-hairpin-helix domain-containing protein [Pyrinomonadaceae bacterium]|jgi:competence ComEA-like helix-hairpin-helix protein